MLRESSSLPGAAALLVCALGAAGCVDDDPLFVTAPTSGELQAVQGAGCVLGDGYPIASGSHVIVYPVTCGSDCNDYPDGGFARYLFCLNGVLGENDPAQAGGSVGAPVPQHLWNGYSRCTALPNPWSTPRYGQSADRKTCVALP